MFITDRKINAAVAQAILNVINDTDRTHDTEETENIYETLRTLTKPYLNGYQAQNTSEGLQLSDLLYCLDFAKWAKKNQVAILPDRAATFVRALQSIVDMGK